MLSKNLFFDTSSHVEENHAEEIMAYKTSLKFTVPISKG